MATTVDVDGRIAVVLGTRPEIIKMAEIVRRVGDRVLLVHTGQHWDHAMSARFMSHLGLPKPEIVLAVGGSSRSSQIAQTLQGLDEVFHTLRPAAVMVQGDTNTVVGGALAANAHGIPLVHVEAGLRSFDRAMPEEHNRVITDHLADLCLAPTQHNRDLLIAEAIPSDRIVVTGNTVVGAVTAALHAGAAAASLAIEAFGLRNGEYVVATIHRPENTDSREQLQSVLSALDALAEKFPILLPLHPRTRARAAEFGLTSLLARLTLLEPMGYEEFVASIRQCCTDDLRFWWSARGGHGLEATAHSRQAINRETGSDRHICSALDRRTWPGENSHGDVRQPRADQTRPLQAPLALRRPRCSGALRPSDIPDAGE